MHDKTVKTNRLIQEPSPYLRQHAHNPVEWYPWGEEALNTAKAEQKLVLVSLGYSTCYWCHVMEREVFESESIAKIMNNNLISIKIDREERPDLDHYFMAVTQLLNQQGGWPNNVFLTPDLKPIFAGTYFGPDDAQGRVGFPTIIKRLQEVWEKDRKGIEESGLRIRSGLHKYLQRNQQEKQSPPDHLPAQVCDSLVRMEDNLNGGFYQAPKFPHETYLLFLLEDEEGRETALKALDAMAAGGIHDLVGGGFHRYSVDAQWRVPHFEKMLYNQALLLECYAKAYTLTQKEEYKLVMDRLVAFLDREMTAPEGAFYSALDAETDGVEGAYYTWEQKDVPADFGLEPLPHFPGHKAPEGDSLFLHSLDDLKKALPELDKLHTLRVKRSYPRRDDKIIASWNGLMIHALAYASYIHQAEKAAEACWKLLYQDKLYRIYAGGKAYVEGQFEDHAFLYQAFVTLFLKTQNEDWQERAGKLKDYIEGNFNDAGNYYSTVSSELPVRMAIYDEGALPSALSVYANALLDNGDRETALNAINAAGYMVQEFPMSHVHLALAWKRYQQSQSNIHPLFKELNPTAPQGCGEDGCKL